MEGGQGGEDGQEEQGGFDRGFLVGGHWLSQAGTLAEGFGQGWCDAEKGGRDQGAVEQEADVVVLRFQDAERALVVGHVVDVGGKDRDDRHHGKPEEPAPAEAVDDAGADPPAAEQEQGQDGKEEGGGVEERQDR